MDDKRWERARIEYNDIVARNPHLVIKTPAYLPPFARRFVPAKDASPRATKVLAY